MRYFLINMVFLGLVFSMTACGETQFRSVPGERWYGAAVSEGSQMPFAVGYEINLIGDVKGNQAAPLLLSNKGNVIWSEGPFAFKVLENKIVITDHRAEVFFENGGKTLRDAYRFASQKYFPPQGTIPDSLLFVSPQYNTWIELVYNQNQADILKYAHAIVDNGFPPGVLMIDDNWAPYYGRFEFRKDRFPDAKGMMDELHELGFKVMLWVCPFISLDCEEGRSLIKKKAVLMSNNGNPDLTWAQAQKPHISAWWNGYSAVLDFSNPEAVAWFQGQLDKMVQEYGLDGFKFDAGDAEYYTGEVLSFGEVSSNEQCRLWGQFGMQYPLNEFRAMWKNGGMPLVERLRDKSHAWGDLSKLIPDMSAAGLLGYPFACPDMIGGGDFMSFQNNDKLDQDLIVRSAQCHALMPMMQFSVAPWRVLDQDHLNAVKKAVDLRQKLVPQIMKLAHKSATTGEPIVAAMEYVFPDQGLEACNDQFMLGDNILVAPVITKKQNRSVSFPKGQWIGEDGKKIKGPVTLDFEVPIDRLLWFKLI